MEEEADKDREEIEPYVETLKVDDYNRMTLHKMSQCNEKFFFQDRYLKKFYIYKLVNVNAGAGFFTKLTIMVKQENKNTNQCYEF